MKFERIMVKNSRTLSVVLLVSLINLLYPQTAVSQDQISVSKEKIEINSTLTKSNLAPKINKTASCEYLPLAPEKKPRKTFHLTVTAYSSTPDQTSGDPFITASGERVRDGIIAYNHLPFGTKVRFPEIFPEKTFVVKDRLRQGAGIYLADIWMPSREEALQWGAKTLKIEVL